MPGLLLAMQSWKEISPVPQTSQILLFLISRKLLSLVHGIERLFFIGSAPLYPRRGPVVPAPQPVQRRRSRASPCTGLYFPLGDLKQGASASGRRPFLLSPYLGPCCLPMRRFPPPWTVEALDGGFKIVDANGQSLAYVYGHADPRDAQVANALTLDEARRIASNIANLH